MYNMNAMQIEWPLLQGKESRMKSSRLELSVTGSVCVSADRSCRFAGIGVTRKIVSLTHSMEKEVQIRKAVGETRDR